MKSPLNTAPPGDEINVQGMNEVFDFLTTSFFRSEVTILDEDFKEARSDKPIIFFGNHGGMAFGFDYHAWKAKLKQMIPHFQTTCVMAPSMLEDDFLFFFGIRHFLSEDRVAATYKGLESVVAEKKNIFIYPEGIAGLGKGFNKRYQLQRFSSSFLRIGLKHGCDFMPVYTINAEYINPYHYNVPFFSRLAKPFGFVFFAMGPSVPLWILFPFLFYTSMPVKLRYFIGPRLKISDFTTKRYEELTDDDFRDITDQIQNRMQKQLTEYVDRYGQDPFEFKSLMAENRRLGAKGLLLNAFAWPFYFNYKALPQNASWGRKLEAVILVTALFIPVLGFPLFRILLAIRRKFFTRQGS